MPLINGLGNFCNGKTYSRWTSVIKLPHGGILATKIQQGKYSQLFIAQDGRLRELSYEGGKITDVIDIKNIKKTYTYRKEKDNTIKGQMIAENNPDKQPILITAAKWVTKNLMPERLILKLNPQHRASEIHIPAKFTDKDTQTKDKTIKATEILAKDFHNEYFPLPKTIIMKNSKGDMEAVMGKSSNDIMSIIEQLEISSHIIGSRLRTFI